MKLKYDKLLSNFGFNCKLRHYTVADVVLWLGWVAIGSFGLGGAMFYVYLNGAAKRTKQVMESGDSMAAAMR